mgnify:FL=1
MCPHCGFSHKDCQCRAIAAKKIRGDGKIRVSRESKGRKGNGVTLINGLPLNENELKILAKQLKQLCGSGGAVKQGVIEIQGEHRDKLVTELCKMGYQALKAGA